MRWAELKPTKTQPEWPKSVGGWGTSKNNSSLYHEKSSSWYDHKMIYVCPMHAEIRQNGPGACPKCGMALEPDVPPTTGHESDPELRMMTRRFWISAACALPVALLGMRQMHPSLRVRWVELALATPVVLWGGWPLFARAWQSTIHRSPNMFTRS